MPPLVLVFIKDPKRVVTAEYLLTKQSHISAIFSSTRANFHVDTEAYDEVVDYLHNMMPHKNRSALYSYIGYERLAKIELAREFYEYLLFHPNTKIEVAPGDPAFVTIPLVVGDFPHVIKVVTDFHEKQLGHRKTREDVEDRIRFLQLNDRAGTTQSPMAISVEIEKRL